MGNHLIIVICAAIVGAAIRYIIKAKKRGVKCIGCSACNGKNCNGCDKQNQEKE